MSYYIPYYYYVPVPFPITPIDCTCSSSGSSNGDDEDKKFIDIGIKKGKNVYVKGLPVNATDEFLYDLVKEFGNVVSCKAIRFQSIQLNGVNSSDSDSGGMSEGLCKGYGFALFESHEEAVFAVEKLNEKGFKASLAKESFSSKLKLLQDHKTTNVYFSNLPERYSDDDFECLLRKCLNGGDIKSRVVLRNAEGESKGTGFARFDSRKTAEEVVKKLNGLLLDESIKPLQVRFADSAAQKWLKSNRKVFE